MSYWGVMLIAQQASHHMPVLEGHGCCCAKVPQYLLYGMQKERDGTEGWIAEQSAVLREVLDVLCGVTGERDSDDTVRESLADAVFLLVRGGTPITIFWTHRWLTDWPWPPICAGAC